MTERQAEPPMGEIDKPPAKINWLGRLHGGNQDNNIWRGTISLSEKTAAKIEDYKKLAERCYVWVSYGAALRCIDGRPAHDRPGELGPQLAGGTPALAVPLHVSESRGGREHFILGDYIEVVKRHDALDLAFKLGAHRDDRASGDSVGCGALDKMPEIIDVMAGSDTQSRVLEFTRAIMDERFDEQTASDVCRRLEELNQPGTKDRWLMANDDYERLTGAPAPEFKKEVLYGIAAKSGDSAVETVLGAHKEALLIINRRQGETFDKDAFAQLTDNEAQAFNYDYWYSAALSESLYPDPSQAKSREMFLTAQVMYNVATAMALTDGSLELGLRD